MKTLLTTIVIQLASILCLADTKTPADSCGVMNLKDENWIVKPVDVKVSDISKESDKAGIIFDKVVRIEAQTFDSNLAITVSNAKAKRVIAGLITKSHEPFQFVVPEGNLEVLCNTKERFVKSTVR